MFSKFKFLAPLCFASVSIVLSGCSTKSTAEEVFGQLQLTPVGPEAPTSPNNPVPAPGEIPPSKDLKFGSNALPIESMDVDTQVFYFNFSKLDAAEIDYSTESTASACEIEPSQTVTLVDFASGSEVTLRALGDFEKIEKPATETVRLKIAVAGLRGCMGYGSTFRIDRI
jgi:hypothetical protein